MGFIKVIKNKAYFRRYQVKFRRRRESKTDYYARKRLIIQDKNKYKSPKYRLVVRFSNKDIITQIVSADLDHDVVLACAYAHELTRYGIKLGLTNYAAAYATGLLLARRVNQKFGLAETYEGNTNPEKAKEWNLGAEFHVEAQDEKHPFRALLDVGLARTTTGARLFGVVKGAADGGLDVPHTDRRFPGTKKSDDGKKIEADPDVHRKYILGGHVADYMAKLQEDDKEAYEKQFKRFIDAKITPKTLEALYTKAHAEIRKDPLKKADPLTKGYFATRAAPKKDGQEYKKVTRPGKISVAQRKNRVRQRLVAQKAHAIPPAEV